MLLMFIVSILFFFPFFSEYFRQMPQNLYIEVNDLLILKPVLGLTPQEEKEMKELKATWNEFDNGKLEVHSEDEFIQEMNKW
jgi:hypothetical protein